MQRFPVDVRGKKKGYRPKLLLQSPIYRKGKGIISESLPGETAISPLLLTTHTDLAWSISIFSSDTQTARDWTHISTVGVAGNYQDHAISEEYYPNGIKTSHISPGLIFTLRWEENGLNFQIKH